MDKAGVLSQIYIQGVTNI